MDKSKVAASFLAHPVVPVVEVLNQASNEIIL